MDGERAELADEGERGEPDLGARLSPQDGATSERSVETQLEWDAALDLGAGDRIVGGLLRAAVGRCFDGGADCVAGGLGGGEAAVLDPGEGGDDEHDRKQHPGEQQQRRDEPELALFAAQLAEQDHGVAACSSAGYCSSGRLALAVTAGRTRGTLKRWGACPLTRTVTSLPLTVALACIAAPAPPATARIASARLIPACGPPVAAARAPSWAAAWATLRAWA